MLKDIKRNSQGIIISTQLVDFGDDYSYIQLERFVRKFNQNTEQTSKSTFSEVYNDRITDIEFEEIKVANSYIFIDKSTGKEINLDETDPAFLIGRPPLSYRFLVPTLPPRPQSAPLVYTHKNEKSVLFSSGSSKHASSV